MNRKDFIVSSATAFLGMSSPFSFLSDIYNTDQKVLTVTGSISADDMGLTLIHEHLLSIFGTEAEEPASYDHQQALNEVVPYLRYLKTLGCDSIVDCSAAYLGRNASLLKKIAELSGMQILISTGIYGAADDRYVPQYAYSESAEELARRWIAEFEQGIQDTGVRPGFLKSGVDAGPLSDIDAKLVRAAALTHLETGLLLQIHTSDNPEAVEQQLKILNEVGVSPEAWVWVHAQNVNDTGILIDTAKKGAWISLDGLRTPNYLNDKRSSDSTLKRHYRHVKGFKEAGMLNHLLLSHDGSTYPPEGVDKRPMDVLFNTFIPMLKAGGFTEEEIHLMTVENPGQAFTIEVLKA